MYKIVFTSVTLSKGAVLKYVFAHFHYFFILLYFLRIIHINFSIDVLGITQKVTSIKKSFHSISFSGGTILKYFGLILGYSPLFVRVAPNLTLSNFLQLFFVIL